MLWMFSFALDYFSFKISQPAVKRKALSGVHARLDTPECDKPSVTQNYLFAISLIVIAPRTPRRVNSKREHSEQTTKSIHQYVCWKSFWCQRSWFGSKTCSVSFRKCTFFVGTSGLYVCRKIRASAGVPSQNLFLWLYCYLKKKPLLSLQSVERK